MSNRTKWQMLALLALAAYGTRDRWLNVPDDGPGPVPNPVVVTDPFPTISAALRNDGRPKRTKVLADLFLGVADIGVPRAANMIGVERVVELAVDIGIGDTPSGAGKMIASEFEKMIDGMPMAINDQTRPVLVQFFRDLSQACTKAL